MKKVKVQLLKKHLVDGKGYEPGSVIELPVDVRDTLVEIGVAKDFQADATPPPQDS